MKKTLQIKTDVVRTNAINLINIIPLDILHEVIIRPYKINRSLLQNALMWVWLGYIAEDLGWTKEDLHDHYKSNLLVPIMLKHPDDYRKFCDLVDAVQDLREKGLIAEADTIASLAVDLVSTTRLKVSHMTEYLQDIEKHAISLNVRLPAPKDCCENYGDKL